MRAGNIVRHPGRQDQLVKSWRGVFDAKSQIVGFVEQRIDGWHVIIAGRDVGTFVSEPTARAFALKVSGIET